MPDQVVYMQDTEYNAAKCRTSLFLGRNGHVAGIDGGEDQTASDVCSPVCVDDADRGAGTQLTIVACSFYGDPAARFRKQVKTKGWSVGQIKLDKFNGKIKFTCSGGNEQALSTALFDNEGNLTFFSQPGFKC